MFTTIGKNKNGTLYVVATPIGNLEDITLRAMRILGEVHLIASEDTRHTRKLLSHLGITTPQISYFKDREAGRAEKIMKKLLEGLDVALVSDAGTPGISDPGHILIKLARKNGIKIIPVPGPSALTAALSVAGLKETAFIFLGFLPSKPAERRKLLKSLLHEQRNLAFYESPIRLSACLTDCFNILGNRNIFWARELTKLHEELQFSSLAELLQSQSITEKRVKGESVLIIQGDHTRKPPQIKDLRELLAWYQKKTDLSMKDTVQCVSKDLGISKSRVYKEALAVWQEVAGKTIS